MNVHLFVLPWVAVKSLQKLRPDGRFLEESFHRYDFGAEAVSTVDGVIHARQKIARREMRVATDG